MGKAFEFAEIERILSPILQSFTQNIVFLPASPNTEARLNHDRFGSSLDIAVVAVVNIKMLLTGRFAIKSGVKMMDEVEIADWFGGGLTSERRLRWCSVSCFPKG